MYGKVDHERAAVLTYSDVQKFLKKLRKKHPCRYLCVGEYGSTKGRAHWHLIIYWKTRNRPKWPLGKDKRFHSPFWAYKDGTPIGFVECQKVTPPAVRYVCKYIQKDIDDPAWQGHLAMSKKPPIGSEYFRQLAQQHVDQELAPQTLEFGWRDVVNTEGKRCSFYMSPTVARDFIDAYDELWKKRWGKRHQPHSELVETYLDRRTRREANDNWVGKWDDPEMITAQQRELDAKRNGMAFSTAWKDADGQPLIWHWDQEGNGKWIAQTGDEGAGRKSDVRSARRKPPGKARSLHRKNSHGDQSRALALDG